MKESFMRKMFESLDGETISFAGGIPDETLFPIEDLKQANTKVYENSHNLQYITSDGVLELREKIAKFYNDEGFTTDAQNILITTGSQQALYIIAKYFQGKAITIEKPSYLGAINIFKLNSLSMDAITLKTNGVKLKQFKKAYKKSKLAYLIPDFQNPIASLYSNEKREKITKYVLKTGGYIIEDAPYSELYFEKSSKSISSRIPENSLHLGSFSKTLLPSLRLGWIRANKEILKEFITIKETIDLHSCSIAQHTVNNYLEDIQNYKDHLQNIRISYKAKMEFFANSLQTYLPLFKFKKPKGGMFIYGSIEGIDTCQLVQKCLHEKVVFVPANQFFLDNTTSNEIRFNFTHSSSEEVVRGLQTIALLC